ncbi:hypothetical protein GCM10010313_24520 [Streptomyces violarus]|uniref:Uncharacterized protein n=1 Tax=Streptomyces violarus TaxID=67380 RepID=A0A7W4ZUG7_9ACTN|nr:MULTISPECIES: hypothetical protein [Streptomyces]MBB3078711.1 hypothetical protein [Streptomyces violarus]WRU03233.1 hypothetical protein VJ737_38575 [Streptomyces sp. CGMCC 4.1772]GHD06429.1 hypothetical protein GCM10010313_24520 [Streptomyces violarus]
MKVKRVRRPVARRRGGMSGQRVLKAEAVLVGGVVLAMLCWEWPSLRREARIWRMAGGFRAGNRYP